MNKEVYKEMCCKIYEGESWDRMINCLERKDKEIERLNQELEKYKYSADELNEIERLNNIIDKAIEYIDWQRRNPQYDNVWRNRECEDLIEILKENK